MGVQLATTRDYRALLTKLAPVALPSVLFLFHASMFGGWLVDDAGISFAYARNLATGHGLVSQPGLPPVEGYSNPLWVFLMAVLYRLHLFVIPATPKLVSAVLVIASFAVVAKFAGRPWATAVVLTLLALNTSFVVWTVSGLENPLYVFLLLALACGSRQTAAEARASCLSAVALGLLATAVALTRPEGVIYVAAFPVILLISRVYRQHRGTTSVLPILLTYTAALAVTFGAFLLFRWHYFGDIVPNTYYAKGTAYFGDGSVMSDTPPAVWRGLDLLSGLGGWPILGLPVWGAAVGYLLVRRQFGLMQMVAGTMLAFTALAYLLLPPDWMKEYRFATPCHVFGYLFIVLITGGFLASLRVSPQARRGTAWALAALAVVASMLVFSARSAAFAREPEVDFDGVRQWMAQRFNWYADTLNLAEGSVLLPDLGATLWYSRLRVYDLGKLCDKTIAKTMAKDQPAFYDYIFEVAKPTFVHTHGSWTYYAALDDDPRFRRDYMPIREHVEPWQPGGGEAPMSGDYVRKDAVVGREAALEQARQREWW